MFDLIFCLIANVDYAQLDQFLNVPPSGGLVIRLRVLYWPSHCKCPVLHPLLYVKTPFLRWLAFYYNLRNDYTSHLVHECQVSLTLYLEVLSLCRGGDARTICL